MAGNNSTEQHSKKQNQTCCHPISIVTDEFTNYLEKTGVIAKVTAVLKLLYEMNEKPVDPLEFIRMNMTEVVPEKVELTKLEEEYDDVMQQIAILQQENMSMMNKLKELERNETNSEENSVIIDLSNDMNSHENA
ncbi:c-Myc-binding protein homolog [Rhopalosiphum maidis]|uniref:c-Myc-binding protein homolog n=1 Tax=Rhopalosiphum maidis TaxID=43146 RepID=UPI000EFE8EA0|nr:c-Myc-binding protein homolog [Rhopalosiphum maidis]